jgi:hypothetical protein
MSTGPLHSHGSNGRWPGLRKEQVQSQWRETGQAVRALDTALPCPYTALMCRCVTAFYGLK